MRKKKMTTADEENDVLRKAKYIVSLEETLKNSSDISYIRCIKFIFTKEFTESTLSLPVKKNEKESFQYLKCFVNIFDKLFNKDEMERCKLYESEISGKLLGSDLFNLMKNLEKLAEGKKLGEYNLKNPSALNKIHDLKEMVNCVFNNYAKTMSNKLFGFLNLYFYYLGFFIQSINTFKMSLYYLLQINDLFRHIDYEEFCPDLQSSNCLNLIKLFFKSIVNEPIEMLTIYAILIFKYQYIFQGIDDGIEEKILEISAKKTLNIVEKKTLDNKIIFEYIFLDFINNLNYYTNQKDLSKVQIEKFEQKDEESKIEVSSKNNIEEVINNEENKIIDNSENKSGINEEAVQNKNEIKYESVQSEKVNREEDKLKDKNSNNENINNENQEQTEKNLPFNEKETDVIKVENGNNSENGSKETNLTNQSLNGNGNSKSNKSEIDEEELNNLFKFESEFSKSPDMQKLFEAFKKMTAKFEKIEKENKEKFEEMKKENIELQNKVSLFETQLNNVQDENNKIIETLGHIQLRDKAKNLLRSFNIILDENDQKKIDRKEKTKWELISEKIKEQYKKYEKSNNYKVFCEIIEKSADTIDEGNKSAHEIKLEYYEKNVDRFIQDNQITIVNPIKMCFLLQINVSRDCLINGYDFLNSYYENDLTRQFTRGKPLEQFFK